MKKQSFNSAVKAVQEKKDTEQRKKEFEKNMNQCELDKKRAIENGKKAKLENDEIAFKMASKQYTLAVKMQHNYQRMVGKIAEAENVKQMMEAQKQYNVQMEKINESFSKKEIGKVTKGAKRVFSGQGKMQDAMDTMDIISDLTYGDDTSDEISENFQNIVDKEMVKDQEETDLLEEVLGSNKDKNEN